MNIGRIGERTINYSGELVTERVITIGKDQGFLALPVRVGVDERTQLACLTTAWEPTPAELEALNNGAQVHVQLLGTRGHPPIIVLVGEPPEEDPPAAANDGRPTPLGAMLEQFVEMCDTGEIPTRTPAPGSASTEHTFRLAASSVWFFDRLAKAIRAARA